MPNSKTSGSDHALGQNMIEQNKTKPSGYAPDEERLALGKVLLELPQELRSNRQVEAAFKTGFRLGWQARSASELKPNAMSESDAWLLTQIQHEHSIQNRM